jgi:hypothetical protein
LFAAILTDVLAEADSDEGDDVSAGASGDLPPHPATTRLSASHGAKASRRPHTAALFFELIAGCKSRVHARNEISEK